MQAEWDEERDFDPSVLPDTFIVLKLDKLIGRILEAAEMMKPSATRPTPGGECRLMADKIAIEGGILTVNEIREAEGYNPMPPAAVPTVTVG